MCQPGLVDPSPKNPRSTAFSAQAGHQTRRWLVGSVEGVVRWWLLIDLSGVEVEGFVNGYRGHLAAVRSRLSELLPTPRSAPCSSPSGSACGSVGCATTCAPCPSPTPGRRSPSAAW